MKLDRLFYWIGLKVSQHPLLIIIISLTATGLLLSGLMLTDFETDPQKLWVSQDSATNHEQIFFAKKFGAFFRINQLILRAENDEDKTDLLQKEYLEKIFHLQEAIEKRTIEFLGTTVSLNDLCYKPISSQGCMVTSPMEFWKMNLTKMKDDPDIKETTKCLKKTVSKDLPCFDRIGTPIQINAVFGHQECENGEEINDCTLCRKKVRALAVTFLLNNNFYINKAAAEWEKQIFQDEIFKFNEKEKSANGNGPKIRIDYMMERSVTDELDEENKQNIWVVVISYLAMFVYISIMMGEFPSIILSRVLVGLGGIVVVILSCLGSIAMVSLMGIKLSLISGEVVPFLVLAIGVDNMFIITGARDRKIQKVEALKKANKQVKDFTPEEYMALTIQEVGPSISTAAFSEFLAFIVGYLTKIPALQSFCLCAAFAVIIDYLLQMTLFVSIVSLDDLRVRSRRYDIFPCFKIADEKTLQPSKGKTKLQRFISETYYKFLMKGPVKLIVLIIYAILIIISFFGIFNFTLGLNQQTTVVQHSDLFNYFKTQEKLVDVGPPAYLILYNIDYNNSTNLDILDKLIDHMSILTSVQPPVYSWYKDFKKFMDPYYQSQCNPDLNHLKTLPLGTQVREFIKKMTVNHSCCTESAICGEPYLGDLFFNENGDIEASRFRFQHIALTNQSIYVDAILQTKVVLREYANQFSLYPGKEKTKNFEIQGEMVDIAPVYPYSLFYVYYDQYITIRGISIQNLLIALATIFLAVQLIMNIKSAFVVTIFVLSCVFNLIGVLWLLNFLPDYIIELNAVSVVNIVCACGLSVEFSVHIVIFYLRCQDPDTKMKAKYSLKNVGVSVFIGIVTTKIIGVTVLLFAPSKVFQIYYFRMYFFLIVVGFFHGFMVLPIFLSHVNIKRRQPTLEPYNPEISDSERDNRLEKEDERTRDAPADELSNKPLLR